MSEQIPIKKISTYRWEIPKGSIPGMRVPGVIYADDGLIKDIMNDASARQVANGATLPGIVSASMAMPDMHFGYGLPIGGVVATDVNNEGVISPGGTGNGRSSWWARYFTVLRIRCSRLRRRPTCFTSPLSHTIACRRC